MMDDGGLKANESPPILVIGKVSGERMAFVADADS